MKELLRNILGESLYEKLRDRLKGQQSSRPALFKRVDFGDLHHPIPFSRSYGLDRGTPIDRYYIEAFLAEHREAIGGNILEFESNNYTYKFHGRPVTHSDVLDISETNKTATIIADITEAPTIASDTYDCIICTQVLHYLYDVSAAVRTLHRILKRDGVLLVTLPSIAQCPKVSMPEYWHFTHASCRKLLEDVFVPARVGVKTYGNVLSATSLLYGLALEEIRNIDLDYNDPMYPLIVAGFARK